MKKLLKKIIVIISFVFNVLFILFSAFVLFNVGNSQSVSYFYIGGKSQHYIHNNFVVSVPFENSDVEYGPVYITLKKGDIAALQFATIINNQDTRHSQQSNLALEPMYDPNVVSIDTSGFGLLVKGIKEGETSLQVFSGGGFRDIAYVLVYDPDQEVSHEE